VVAHTLLRTGCCGDGGHGPPDVGPLDSSKRTETCKIAAARSRISRGLLFAAGAQAAPAFWTDWTSTTAGAPQVLGTLNVSGTPVGVTFTGAYSFAQTSGGTNYWLPSGPYVSPTVDNPPPDSDIVALNTGGTATIAFSAPVSNPLIGLVSWNGNTVDFGVPIEILSFARASGATEPRS